MDVIGVVGEFNPLHLGHVEHFKKSRDLLSTDAPIVCVMSGDFVQRGEPACFDKHTRAAMAVRCGADLVFELPLPWSLASAERFALGAVGLLDDLGVVTHLSFGSEAGSLAPLTALAIAAADEANLERVRQEMAGGMSFAAAREKVLHQTLGPEARLLESPNNILAVEYLKALLALHSPMEPITTARTESQHDRHSDGAVRSAGQLRSMQAEGRPITSHVPAEAEQLMAAQRAAGRGPVTTERLEQALMSRLRLLSAEDFCALPDATEGLGNRFYAAARDEGAVMGVLSAVKTKRYPLSRLRRMALCAALGVRAGMAEGNVPYARLLASTERGRALLRQVRMNVVTKPAAVKLMDEWSQRIFQLTADARDFYVLGYEAAEERKGGSDWRTSPAAV